MNHLSPPEQDAYEISEVGHWSIEKHHYLWRYIDIFTTGMKNKNWELHCVDLFANSGIELVHDKKLQWGSPLLAAQATNRFHRLHLCEKRPEAFEALEKRIQKFPQPRPPQLIHGDANEKVSLICDAIPARGTLTLAFVDPYGLHANFDVLRALSGQGRRVDFIIFFPDHVDALRNANLYGDQDESNLDKTFGSRGWREIIDDGPSNRRAERLRLFYEERMATLGYQFFDFRRIRRTDGVPLYVLLFCSRNERGGDFWKKIAAKDSGGQGSLDFG